MELTAWRAFVSLGVPGLALGILYMLFRRFHWQFPEVPRVWVGPIIVLFMAITGGIVYTALENWAPVRPTVTTPAPVIAETKPIGPAGPTTPTEQIPPGNVKWKRALVDMQERYNHDLRYGTHAYNVYGGVQPTVWTNREILLRMLTRLDVSMDARLVAKRNKIIALVKAAPAGPGVNSMGGRDLSDYFDMAYSDELKAALDDLDFEIRDGAAAHGVDVSEGK